MTMGWFQHFEWVQLDAWGRITGQPFSGTHEDLVTHLTNAARPYEYVLTEDVMVYVEQGPNGEQLQTLCVTVTGPWARQKWIPRPTRLPDI